VKAEAFSSSSVLSWSISFILFNIKKKSIAEKEAKKRSNGPLKIKKNIYFLCV